MTVEVVEQTRGPLVENIYRGDAAIVDGSGRLLYQVGDAAKVSFWRSSAKPIQAMPLVMTGAAERFGFGAEHLAVFCASHNGEKVHTQTILDAMRLAGLTPDQLRCGVHNPFDSETLQAMADAGEQPGTVHNNCSGKHTGMLAMAKHLGLPLDNYLTPDSELQQLILKTVAQVVGLPAERIAIGVDGCGVPVFGLPVHNMALAFARLADPATMPESMGEAGRRFRDAMMQYPYNVAGRNRICTELMGLPGRRFVAKSGAEGVYCVGALPEAVAASPVLRAAGITGGVGIAVKVEDGNKDIRHLMTVEIMRQLGLVTEADLAGGLAPYRPVAITNHAGTLVGERRPSFTVERVS